MKLYPWQRKAAIVMPIEANSDCLSQKGVIREVSPKLQLLQDMRDCPAAQGINSQTNINDIKNEINAKKKSDDEENDD